MSSTPGPNVAHSSDFLGLFPTNRRSTVANIFLAPIRDKRATLPVALVRVVRDDMRDRLKRVGRYGREDETAAAILDAIEGDPERATRYAKYCLDYEALPRDQRERLKAGTKAEAINGYMDREPATEKQAAYLRREGYDGPIDSKRHASALIDIYTRGYVVVRRGGAA